MPKKILTVGFELAVDNVESTGFSTKVSLLDWDIILLRPDISHITSYDPYNTQYMGKLSLTDKKSFELKEACAHWRREINQAVDAGKLVIVFLCPPEDVFVKTGQISTSGTGRNARTTHHVEPLSNYNAITVRARWTQTVGTAMVLQPNTGDLLASYWRKFGSRSQYNVVWAEDVGGACITTQHGHKPVGLSIPSKTSAGALLLLPDLDFDNPNFLSDDEDSDDYWSQAAEQFGASLVGEIVALAKAIASDGEKTPQPEWASGTEYTLAPEINLRQQLLLAETELEKAQRAKDDLTIRLDEAGQLRALLFEKGKPLEAAIIAALRVLGFNAEPYEDGKSEFDAVFESAGGRLLGEAEGKDNKPINIDKLRQLATNIHEDLQRDEVTKPAKGILFGNGYRLTKPEEREAQFTEKCVTSATSMSHGLVSTDRLYAVVQYLSGTEDEDFARQCRAAMLESSGIVQFPQVPSATANEAASAEVETMSN